MSVFPAELQSFHILIYITGTFEIFRYEMIVIGSYSVLPGPGSAFSQQPPVTRGHFACRLSTSCPLRIIYMSTKIIL
jgi:hypothetical protein